MGTNLNSTLEMELLFLPKDVCLTLDVPPDILLSLCLALLLTKPWLNLSYGRKRTPANTNVEKYTSCPRLWMRRLPDYTWVPLEPSLLFLVMNNLSTLVSQLRVPTSLTPTGIKEITCII